MKSCSRTTIVLFTFVLGWPSVAFSEENRQPDIIQFSRDILPILSDRCFHCHGPDAENREAGLRLDLRESAVEELAVIAPNHPDDSELLTRITTEDLDLLMPPPESHRKPLSVTEIDLLRRWIAEGAQWGKHWAFEKPVRPRVPDASVHPIDAFVRRRLKDAGLEPSPEADRRTLIRRVTLDLIGMPPSIAEVNAFVTDDSPLAYENLVDRLLASQHYGERMAWPWLDAARYADTSGFQGDPERTMWPWRDWVVDALNDNMPFDQFTVEQLAGDLLEHATPEQRLATGFNRNHMHNGEGGRIAEETRIENVFDRTETTGTVWLGLTLQCARCHDHKFDPTSNEDYFAFFDFFNQTSESGGGNRSLAVPPSLDYVAPDHREMLDTLREKIAKLKSKWTVASESADAAQLTWESNHNEDDAVEATAERPEEDVQVSEILAKPSGERSEQERTQLREHFLIHHWPDVTESIRQWKKAKTELQRLEKKNKPVAVMVMDTIKKPRETLVLLKGIYNSTTDQKVVANVPGMLPPLPPKLDDARYSRLDLARWIVSPENPLTARVTVNRYWQLFFGRGIVATPSDFGLQGAQPTHPDLLDWLAVEFVESGWDVKQMHRLIVTSETYRQSARVSKEMFERDPLNEKLARASRYRMPSWMIRDASLAASGLLVDRLGGPSVKSYQPDGIWAEATFGKIRYKQDSKESLYRRSLYSFWRRIVGPSVFFDSSKRQTCEVQPNLTNTPLHALTTLNDVTFVEAARVMAERMIQKHESDSEQIIEAFSALTARKPVPDELQLLENRLVATREQFREDPQSSTALLSVGESPRDGTIDVAHHAALTTIINTLMNLDEFLVKP